MYNIQDIPMESIICDEGFNNRHMILVSDVMELSDNIRDYGLLNPIKVRVMPNDKYKIIFGHRRFKAIQLLGWEEIECIVTECTDEEATIQNISENIMRKNLTMTEEAEIVATLSLEPHSKSLPEIATLLNKSRGWVSIRSQFSKVPPDIQAVYEAGYLTNRDIQSIHGMMEDETKTIDEVYEMVSLLKTKKQSQEGLTVAEIKEATERKREGTPKKIRSVAEITEMQDYLRETGFGNNFSTILLAWVMGFRATEELKELAVTEMI